MNSELKKIFSYHYWRQDIKLDNNYSTGGKINESYWEKFNFPEVRNKSFLDIGSNDGLFSFLAEKKGAKKVVASDLYKESVDSMENGWSYKGINLLKDLFKSNITIHTKGIYHLSELNQKFDVVLVNHVVNWLDNIELALDNLANACNNELIISDGFLTEENVYNETKPSNMPILKMYKTSYFADLLRRKGFEIISIEEVNYQSIFMQLYLKFPVIKAEIDTKVYDYPDENSPYKLLSKPTKEDSFSYVNGYYRLFGQGWVHENSVYVYYYKASIIYKLCNALGLLSLYFSFKNWRFKKKNKYAYYVINASKLETSK